MSTTANTADDGWVSLDVEGYYCTEFGGVS